MNAETYVEAVEAPRWRPLFLIQTLRDAGRSRPSQMLLLTWLAGTLLCVILGIVQVNLAWNGLPIQLGPLRFSVTIYPPLVICVCMVFWLGFEWAFSVCLHRHIHPGSQMSMGAAAWRDVRRGIKVLYISGYTEKGLNLQDLDSITGFLEKPFAPSVLSQRVRELLDVVA